ncbi:MAG: FliM/FliN family flagellar motor switch protein [Armatimonadetes bacterium]|nr:FliM/FliN family flagellar motor switch protein [Armatimonadota bacterium]
MSEQHPNLLGQVGRQRKLLSQEELDALVSALQAVAARGARGPQKRLTVSLFDFRHIVQLSPEELRSLEAECRTLCRILSRTIVPYLNVEADFQLLSVGVATVDQFMHNFAPTPVVCVFRFSGHSPIAMWEITPPLAFAIVERMLGASSHSPPPAREMTVIEMAIMKRFFNELLSIWQLTWRALEKARVQVDFVTSSVAKVDMRQVDNNVVHIVLQARIGDREGTMNIGLPVSAVRALVKQEDIRAGDEMEEAMKGVPSHVKPVGVEIAVRLPPVRMEFGELGRIRVGELVPLGHRADTPLVVHVNGVPKFVGEAGLVDGRMAVRIAEPIE